MAPCAGISNITGSTITIGEEVDEGGASYTVNVGSATITKAGVAATIADLKVGDKVFVQGAVTGNTVQATSISDGPHGGFGGHDNDKEGIDLPEAGDTSDAPGAGN